MASWMKKRRTRPWVQVPMSVAGTLYVRVAAPGLVELSLRNGQPAATGTVVLGTLPVGYRPSRSQDVAATAWQYVSHVYTTDEEVA